MKHAISHRKKGFTIAELVIVIVVIAVLAAVLIPLFANLIERARLSVDQQTVDGMNQVLQIDEILNGKPASLNAAKAVLEDGNYRGNIAPTAKDYEFYWIPAENRVVLVKMNGDTPESVVYPKALADQYATLPTEWYRLSESGEAPADPCADGHLVENWTVIVEPTCTESGYQIGNCTRCGELCVEELAAAHTVVYDKTNNPYKDKHVGVCSICGILTTDTQGEACDTAGANGVCSKCGSIAHDCAASGHVWYIQENIINKNPDRVCAICGNWHYYHSAACDADGEGGACSICGYKACEHTVTDWTVTKSPTCTEAGARTGTCTACGNTVQETVDATGHVIAHFAEVNVFQHKGVCTVCGESASESHKFESIGTGADADGVYHYQCACGTRMDVSGTEHPDHVHTSLNINSSEWGKTTTTIDGTEYRVWICSCPPTGCGAKITYYVPVALS